MLLAIDVSTTITGFCVFDESGEPVHISNVDMTKVSDFFEKATLIKRHLYDLKFTNNIKCVVIEESLQAFRAGSSSAKTLFKLSKFNGIIQWLCYNDLEIPVHVLNVNTARKLTGIKVNRKSVVNKKEQILKQVMEQTQDKFEWPTKILKSGPRRGFEIYDKCCYDMADAYVIGKAFYLKSREE